MTGTTFAQLGQYLKEHITNNTVNPGALGTEEDFLNALGETPSSGTNILTAVGEAINTQDTAIRTILNTKAMKTADMPILDVDFITGVPSGWTYSRTSTATYTDANGNIQTAAVNTPRSERDPLTGRKLGMLIEKQRTNQFRWSDKFDDNAWIKNQATVSQHSADGTSPLGVHWWRLSENTAHEEHSVVQYVSLAPGKHTLSAMVKDGGTMSQFGIGANGDNGVWYARATFDTTTHTLSSTFFDNPTVVLQRTDIRRIKADVWIYSLTIHVNNPTSVNAFVGILGASGGGNQFYTGTERNLLMAYLQLENGACRTSYIPTTDAAATRARDVLYQNVSEVTGFSQIRGTMAVEVTPLTGAADNQCFVNINGGESDAFIDLLMTSDRFQMQFFANTVNTVVGTLDYSWRVGVPTTLVGAWGDQQYAFAEAGWIEYNHLGGLSPNILSRINIGNRNIPGETDGDLMDGHFCIRRLRIWEDRLSDQDVVKLSMLQEDRVRSDRQYRLGVGANSTATNQNRVLDVNPGPEQGRGSGVVNISSIVHVNRPLNANMFPTGLQVSMAGTSDWRAVEESTRYVGAVGISSTMTRNNAVDSSSSVNNYIYGGIFSAGHGTSLNTSAVTGTVWGIQCGVTNASGTINTAYGIRANTVASGIAAGTKSGTFGTAYALFANTQANSGGSGETAYAGTLNTAYGVYVNSTTTAIGTNGTIGTLYGMYIATQPEMQVGGVGGGVITEKYAIYQAGTNDKSYFGGTVSTGALAPHTDGVPDLGKPDKRWSQLFAASEIISTSDARRKTEVIPLSTAEIAASKDLAREIGTYRFLTAIDAKGEDARFHIGMTVQRAITIMESHGLNPMVYGFICYDTWDAKTVEHPAKTETFENEDGEITSTVISPAWTEHVPAGDAYSFRVSELLMFIARGLEARLTALET